MIRRLLAAITAAVLLAACSAAPGAEVVVGAASSMEPALREAASVYESDHPGVSVTMTIGGSTLLRDQVLIARAPLDLVILADIALLAPVEEAGLTSGSVTPVAANGLVLAVPMGNPAGVTALDDLADQELVVGLCAVGVPCGDLAADALSAAGVVPAVDTYEPNVRSLATKLEAGELDAAMVYSTDVVAARGALAAVPLPGTLPTTTYGAVVTTTGSTPGVAADFLAFLASETGAGILAEYGFGAP